MSNVIGDIVKDVKTGMVTPVEKITVGLLAFIFIFAIICFVVIFKKVKTDKDNQWKDKVTVLDSSNREKDRYIQSLQRNIAEKDLRIGVYVQRDSSLQQIAINNNYLLKKLNEKDDQISHHVNSSSFTKDSLRSAILSGY